MSTNLINIEKTFSEGIEYFKRGGELLAKGCECIRMAYDANTERTTELALSSGISSGQLQRIIAVSRGTMLSQFLLPQSAGFTALARCDIALQKKHLTEPVEVVDPETPSDSRLVSVCEMSQKQVSQVFANGRIRSLAEQRTWLQEHRFVVAKPVAAQSAYKIRRDGKVEIGGVLFTKRDLLTILQELA